MRSDHKADEKRVNEVVRDACKGSYVGSVMYPLVDFLIVPTSFLAGFWTGINHAQGRADLPTYASIALPLFLGAYGTITYHQVGQRILNYMGKHSRTTTDKNLMKDCLDEVVADINEGTRALLSETLIEVSESGGYDQTTLILQEYLSCGEDDDRKRKLVENIPSLTLLDIQLSSRQREILAREVEPDTKWFHGAALGAISSLFSGVGYLLGRSIG